MKKKLLAVTILATLLITGCGGSKPNSELDKITNEIVVDPNGTTIAPTAGATETPVEDEASEQTANEEDKYYLTFEATTTEGEAWNSDQFANSKLTMINVWGTYCNPCLAEMPDLGEIATEYDATEFQIIGIICDVMDTDGQDAIEGAKKLIAETKANYPHLLLNESLYTNLVGAVSAVPTTFFVRQDGSLIGYLTGAQSKENWKSLIDQLLAEE